MANQLEAEYHGHPWVPLPGPQTWAAQSKAHVLGFGGSSGGGKSDLLLGLALTRQRRSILFRREAKQVRAMIDRTAEILKTTEGLNRVDGIWRGLKGGRQIEFAGVKDLGSEQKYQGQPHDFLGFDEADKFLESQVRFLMGWNRTTTPGQECRTVLAFNPPTCAEGRWLLSFFGPWLDKKHPRPARLGELRWYATLPDGAEVERSDDRPFDAAGSKGAERIVPRSRTFIPSRVTDNPYLMGTGYVSVLQAMPEPLRSMLLHGDFAAGLEDDPWQVIPTAWVEAAFARWTPEGRGERPMTALGVDVAYGGDDKTVLAPRYRTWFDRAKRHAGCDTPDGHATAGLVLAVFEGKARDRQAQVNIDAIGWGASAYDLLKDKLPRVNAIVFSEGSEEMDRAGVLHFRNLRAEAWWGMREALDPVRGDNLALPPDPELLADLTAPRWKMTTGGVLIEAKEDVKARIGRSPDVGDAYVLARLDRGSVTAAPRTLGQSVPRVRG